MSGIPVPSEVLGAMITPAVLISASGLLALSTSNRLGRVVDRVRVLVVEVERLHLVPGETREAKGGAWCEAPARILTWEVRDAVESTCC